MYNDHLVQLPDQFKAEVVWVFFGIESGEGHEWYHEGFLWVDKH